MDLFVISSLLGAVAILVFGVRRYSKAIEMEENTNRKIAQTVSEFDTAHKNLETKKKELEEFEQKIQEEKKVVENFISTKVSQYPVIGKMLADYHSARDEAIAASLIYKKRPALYAAEQISMLKEEKNRLRTKQLADSWMLEQICSIAPAFRHLRESTAETATETMQSYVMEKYQMKLQAANQYYEKKIQDADVYYDEKRNAADKYFSDKVDMANNSIKEQEAFIEKLIQSKISDFPIVALAIADYRAQKEALALQQAKGRQSAPTKTAQAKQLSEEKRKLLAENLSYKWELNYLHSLLPWIEELEDEPMEALQEDNEFNPASESDDPVSRWLSPEEYRSLSTTEKNQRALNRYINRNKSNAEIGRDYERYIGYKCEEKGYKVTYYGVEKGLEDLGRDLVCTKGRQILIVQCKCWSNKKKKVIREKHINQLYGTTIKYYIDRCTPNDNCHPDGSLNLFPSLQHESMKIIPVFVSTVPYSETALKFADALGVQCKQIELEEYPMIKCNIGKSGERIYHLPFDQQYDKVVIDTKAGECYAMTVQEAEEKGFRRAMRWHGN